MCIPFFFSQLVNKTSRYPSAKHWWEENSVGREIFNWIELDPIFLKPCF